MQGGFLPSYLARFHSVRIARSAHPVHMQCNYLAREERCEKLLGERSHRCFPARIGVRKIAPLNKVRYIIFYWNFDGKKRYTHGVVCPCGIIMTWTVPMD